MPSFNKPTKVQQSATSQPVPPEAIFQAAEGADTIRALVEGQRQKIVADGYPESVSWRMAAEMWAGIWRSMGAA